MTRRNVILLAAGIVAFIVIAPVAGAAIRHADQGGTSSGGTVTYMVSGTGSADVTYGPAGSDIAGSVPMQVTARLGGAAYYAIWAQLQGSGSVSCQIKVNGAVVSQGSADGSYRIAQCEISQSGGQWVSDTG